ncbi:basic amino acid/polyamine antiporter, APA family [Allokutzneria albata]|uniref:Basic amino acid/polyamine antiporter, APA family n=1 Tax=Allokutzneria albata TaxID=211114 RepID=A0A1H0CNG9_ALLAB|nr:basic amino acid/polyamine antiporter, APA family [Allokutzneria albata]
MVLGLGAMIGLGPFLLLAPAAASAGIWLLAGLPLAAVTALCAMYSTSERSSIREHMGRWPGRVAGTGRFVALGCLAVVLARTFAEHVAPDQPDLAAFAVLAVAAAGNASGLLRWGSGLAWLIGGVVLLVLVLVIAACLAVAPPVAPIGAPAAQVGDPRSLMTAAAILFLGFVGFERVTAPADGEPQHGWRTTRRAIPVIAGVVTVLYALLGVALLHQLGPARLALSPAPLRDAVIAADGAVMVPFVEFGAGVGLASCLVLVLVAMRRMVVEAAIEREVATPLATIARAGTTWPIDLVVGGLVVLALPLLDLTGAVHLAACCVLVHYAFANAATRVELIDQQRTWPMRTACFGLGISVMLAMSLPPMTLLTTLVVLVVGSCLGALISHRWR